MSFLLASRFIFRECSLDVSSRFDEYGAVQKDGAVDCGEIDAACADEIVQLALFGEVQFA